MDPMKLQSYNQPVDDVFTGRKKYDGEVGIEIEVEGQRLPLEIPSYWSVHQDGSLRGESAEYVLSKPVKRDHTHQFLRYLKKRLDDNGAIPSMSNRTSVHIHLNCQGQSFRQVYSLICLYLLFEDMLTEYAGPTRVGNLFCLRAKDAEFLIDKLIDVLRRENYSTFTEENRLRYSSINICALAKFNSLEFRALRGTVDPDTIQQWITLLLAIKDAAANYPDPRVILQEFSGLGPMNFMHKVFPDPLWRCFNMVNAEERLWESARLIQDIAYAVDWEVPQFTVKRRTFTAHDPVPRAEGNPLVVRAARAGAPAPRGAGGGLADFIRQEERRRIEQLAEAQRLGIPVPEWGNPEGRPN